MKIGQTIYVGPSFLPATFAGFATNGFVKAKSGGNFLCVPPEKVQANNRRPSGRPKKWELGSPVTVQIYGFDGKHTGEVVSSDPLKVRINDGDKVWHGAVLNDRDAKIRKVE